MVGFAATSLDGALVQSLDARAGDWLYGVVKGGNAAGLVGGAARSSDRWRALTGPIFRAQRADGRIELGRVDAVGRQHHL